MFSPIIVENERSHLILMLLSDTVSHTANISGESKGIVRCKLTNFPQGRKALFIFSQN
jgi:hypothetical protein